MQPHRSYPLIHTIHKERKKEAKKERKAATTTSTFLFDATRGARCLCGRVAS